MRVHVQTQRGAEFDNDVQWKVGRNLLQQISIFVTDLRHDRVVAFLQLHVILECEGVFVTTTNAAAVAADHLQQLVTMCATADEMRRYELS